MSVYMCVYIFSDLDRIKISIYHTYTIFVVITSQPTQIIFGHTFDVSDFNLIKSRYFAVKQTKLYYTTAVP